MRGCGRKLSCIDMRGCGRKRKGVDENSWQSRQLHRRFQRLTVWIVQSNVCRALAGCVERTAGHASVWIATSFACGCSCTRSVSSTQPAASHHLPRVGNCLTVATQRHNAAAPHRAVMGIKRRPVERPVEHACAEAPRAPRNRRRLSACVAPVACSPPNRRIPGRLLRGRRHSTSHVTGRHLHERRHRDISAGEVTSSASRHGA